MGRLVLVQTSPRVAPGLLSWPAWQAISTADRVLCGSDDLPACRGVRNAGVPVEVVSGDPDEQAAAALSASRSAHVVWLSGDGEEALATALGERGAEVAVGSFDLPGAGVVDVVRVMDELRRRCPWDQQQTHESLARYLVEETYEALEAVESENSSHLREELGDLLLQVAFHARIAEEDEQQPWTLDDVARGLVEKLVSRHPHVFAGLAVADATEVEVNWEQLKAGEKRRASALDGVPLALPALALAAKLVQRADRAGLSELTPTGPSDLDDLGAELLRLAAAAARAGLDPEQLLRTELRRFADRVRAAE